jgi:hypothetical protein
MNKTKAIRIGTARCMSADSKSILTFGSRANREDFANQESQIAAT